MERGRTVRRVRPAYFVPVMALAFRRRFRIVRSNSPRVVLGAPLWFNRPCSSIRPMTTIWRNLIAGGILSLLARARIVRRTKASTGAYEGGRLSDVYRVAGTERPIGAENGRYVGHTHAGKPRAARISPRGPWGY